VAEACFPRGGLETKKKKGDEQEDEQEQQQPNDGATAEDDDAGDSATSEDKKKKDAPAAGPERTVIADLPLLVADGEALTSFLLAWARRTRLELVAMLHFAGINKRLLPNVLSTVLSVPLKSENFANAAAAVAAPAESSNPWALLFGGGGDDPNGRRICDSPRLPHARALRRPWRSDQALLRSARWPSAAVERVTVQEKLAALLNTTAAPREALQKKRSNSAKCGLLLQLAPAAAGLLFCPLCVLSQPRSVCSEISRKQLSLSTVRWQFTMQPTRSALKASRAPSSLTAVTTIEDCGVGLGRWSEAKWPFQPSVVAAHLAMRSSCCRISSQSFHFTHARSSLAVSCSFALLSDKDHIFFISL
jgi:hypothetical protein